MDSLREWVERRYSRNRDALFSRTEYDPEIAHEEFVRTSQRLSRFGLSRLFLHHSDNDHVSPVGISNAAGFNKNGAIPPSFLYHLGFDRAVIGTVTADAWKGNDRPRIQRFSPGSIVNWMGLPGEGVDRVVERLESYRRSPIPLTISLMATPGKQGDDVLEDLAQTTRATRHILGVDRYELNVSCPNTKEIQGDARQGYEVDLKNKILATRESMHNYQELFVKVSPDLEAAGVATFVDVSRERRLGVSGFTTANTTTYHDPDFISHSKSPGKGGASGAAVYERSKRVQDLFERYLTEARSSLSLIACGGIHSKDRALERTMSPNVTGIQIFTPLIFKGPGLLREIRRYL